MKVRKIRLTKLGEANYSESNIIEGNLSLHEDSMFPQKPTVGRTICN